MVPGKIDFMAFIARIDYVQGGHTFCAMLNFNRLIDFFLHILLLIQWNWKREIFVFEKQKGLNSLLKEPETSDKLKEKVELWLSIVRGFGALLWWQGGFCWYGLEINVKLFWLITFILW